MSANAGTAPGDFTASNRQIIIAALASCLGWAFDLFDLFLILYVAPIIGHLFFPSDHPTLSLAAVYASFAVTLLMRPVGSALFGSYADRHGRRITLIRTMIGVGVATALLGTLPTLQQVGLLAPVLFLLLRLLQGIFVGGVVACTGTIGIETVAPRWRGLMSGMMGGGGGGIGGLFASLVFWLAHLLFPGAAFAVWGWRFMFFMGLASSLLGVLVFSQLEESPLFRKLQAGKGKKEKAPVRALFSARYRPIFWTNLLLTMGGGAGYYLTSGFMPAYLKLVSHQSPGAMSAILALASIAAFIAAISIGQASEYLGRRGSFRILGVIRLIMLPGLYLLMRDTTDPVMVGVYGVTLCFLGSAGYAPMLAYLNERYPTALRASGVGLSWNIGFAIGGVMPAVVSAVSGSIGNLSSTLAIFLFVFSVIYMIGAIVTPETKGMMD